MSDAQRFFTRLKTELGRTRTTDRFTDHFQSTAQSLKNNDNVFPRLSHEDQEELIETFAVNCAPLNTSLHRVDSFLQAADTVVELIRESRVEFGHNRHVMQHDHPDIAALELWKRFTREAVTLHTSFAGEGQLREKSIASFIGITAPELAVAESGTLLECSGPGHPRSTSLVPSIHIALLPVDRLVARLEQAYLYLQQREIPDNFVFISGPSKTADIEAHLVHGAHGPCEVHVVLIAPSLKAKTEQGTP